MLTRWSCGNRSAGMTAFWKAERRYRKRLPLDVRRLATDYFMPSSFPGSSRLFLVFPMASVGAVRLEHRASRPGEDLRCVRRLEPNRATRAAAKSEAHTSELQLLIR